MEKAVESMRSQPTLVTAQRNGAVLLAHLLKAQGEPAAQKLLSDGLQVLLTAMRTHGESSEVQRWCCEVLAGLADHGGQAGAEAVVAQGGLNNVVSAMQRHLQSCEVQSWGATALSCIARSGGHTAVEVTAKSGVVEALVLAMTTHPDSVFVQEHGASALSFIALDGGSEVVNTVVYEGGLKAVATAMHTHSDNSAVQRWGLAAMWATIEEGGKPLLEILMSIDGISAAVRAVRTFPARPEVQHWGLAFLRTLSANCDDVALHAVITSGAIPAIIAAMTSLRDNAEVQERGLATLAMLASHSCEREVDMWTSGLEAVVSGMHLHVASLEVQRWGISALAALADGRPKAEALDRSIVAAAVAAMGAHLDDLELQVMGQDVLWTMTHNEGEEVVKLVLQGGSAQAVMAAARAHPNSVELARACKAWSQLMEMMAFELCAVEEATALAYPPEDPAENGTSEADDATTTATDSEADRGISGYENEHPPVGDVTNAVTFSDDLEVEL